MPTRKKPAGLFVTFEGIDGCGKSTQLELSYKYLTSLGFKVDRLREPGSTPVAEQIRKILLDTRSDIGDLTELLLYEAARSEITRLEIVPRLKAGKIVLCDRFYDSTTAYQGYGRKLDLRTVKRLNHVAVGETRPDLTLVFDVSLATSARRMGKKRDRLESQAQAFHRRVRQGFKKIAAAESRRVKLVDGTPSPQRVFEIVRHHLDRKIKSL